MGRHKKSSRRHDNYGPPRGDSEGYGYGYGGYNQAPPPPNGGGYDYGYPPSSQYTDYSRPPNDYEYQSYDYDAPPGGRIPPTKEEVEQARQETRQRNFDVWAKWRSNMNDSILADFEGGEPRPIPPLDVALQDQPNPGPQNDPNLLMNYSVATNSVTDLESDAFLKFGIPRAKLNLKNLEYRSLFSANGERHVRVETEHGREKMYVVRIPVERT